MTVTASHRDVLRSASLFAALGEAEIDRIADRCTARSYAKGDVLWRAGDEADELIIVASGELDVVGVDDEVLGRVRPGEVAGEIALLLDERRSAGVVCGRAAEVLVLSKHDFREVARDDPRVLAHLTQLLSRRALSLAQRRPTSTRCTVVAVVHRPGVELDGTVAGAVASLAATSLGVPTILVRDGEPSDVRPWLGGASITSRAIGRAGATDLAALVDAFEDAFRLVVLDVPGEAAVGACDAVVEVSTNARRETATYAAGVPVHHVVCRTSPAPIGPVSACDPYVLTPGIMSLGTDTDDRVAALLADPWTVDARTLGRLARKLLGATVGVALGGGAAFGIAHVGVLAALEEAGIPVDLVAGTSMGSIVALGYGAGLRPREMYDSAERIGNVRTTLSVLDPALDGTGLLGGRRLVAIFAPLLPHETFDDLVVPCRVVAMDVETGDRVDIGRGRLDTAFRASCAIPIVFAPVRLEGRTLVDGGMVDPVPSDVVREMGADIVVGINVIPRPQRGVTTALSRTFKRVNRLNPLSWLAGSRDLPDIVDVLMNSLQVVQYELGSFKSLSADVRVDVEMADFTWIEFYRAMEIIERGRASGAQAAAEVAAAIAARVAP